MSTKRYAVIGHPIGHTMSPFIHKRLFDLAQIDAEYTKMDIAPEDLAQEYERTLKQLDGYNITIPHKQSIIPLLDSLDDKAALYGSVNTVSNAGGKSKGYTTDPDGFIKAIEAAGIALDGRIMILGCGGWRSGTSPSSSPCAVRALERQGCSALTLRARCRTPRSALG